MLLHMFLKTMFSCFKTFWNVSELETSTRYVSYVGMMTPLHDNFLSSPGGIDELFTGLYLHQFSFVLHIWWSARLRYFLPSWCWIKYYYSSSTKAKTVQIVQPLLRYFLPRIHVHSTLVAHVWFWSFEFACCFPQLTVFACFWA